MRIDGNKVKLLREKASIGRVDLAAAADLGERRIQQIEALRSVNLNMNIAKAIARKLGVKLEEIAKGLC